jgi:hypothetical protein
MTPHSPDHADHVSQPPGSSHQRTARRSDLDRLLGDTDPSKLSQILALEPTMAEVEEAVLWSSGDGDILGKQGLQLTGKVAAIFDIIMADEQGLPPPNP